MNRTKIEWVKNPDGSQGYTINPVKGECPMPCSYCYAKRMYKRFKWNPEIRFENPRIKMPPEGSRIFVGSTMELFGEWIKPVWLEWLFGSIREHKAHTFIFLTKQPQNLIKWSPFPENCWVGLTLTDFNGATHKLADFLLAKASLKFLSLEPLLGRFPAMAVNSDWFQWLIIGQQTPVSAKTEPKIEWLREIVEAADRAGIPVFLKNNLESLWTLENSREPFFKFTRPSPGATEIGKLRQEMLGD